MKQYLPPRDMWKILLCAVLIAHSTTGSQIHESLFQVFKALYFSSGLQFEYDFGAGNMSLNGKTQIWVEGNLKPVSNINCSNDLTKVCKIIARTGNIILEQRTKPTIRLSDCLLVVTVSEIYNSSWALSVPSVSLSGCADSTEGTSAEYQLTAALHDLAGRYLTFKYDIYVDSYPINKIKESAMQAIFGLVMHAKGRIKV